MEKFRRELHPAGGESLSSGIPQGVLTEKLRALEDLAQARSREQDDQRRVMTDEEARIEKDALDIVEGMLHSASSVLDALRAVAEAVNRMGEAETK